MHLLTDPLYYLHPSGLKHVNCQHLMVDIISQPGIMPFTSNCSFSSFFACGLLNLRPLCSAEINGKVWVEANDRVPLKDLESFPMIRFIFDKMPDSQLLFNPRAPTRCISDYKAFIKTPLASKLASKCLFPLVENVHKLEKFEIDSFFGKV